MLIDPLRLAIALVPFAAYLGVIGLLNLRRKPFMTSAACDLAALGAALSGFAVIGPIELMMPQAAAIRFGNYIWLFLLAFYWLCVSLAIVLSRPRIIIYNISADALRPVLADAVKKLDDTARWAGDALLLPKLGAQLHMDVFSVMRHVSLVASGPRQDLQGWRRLELEIAAALKRTTAPRNPRGVAMVGVAALLAVFTLTHLVNNPLELAQAMRDWAP